jgi:hypothetical protein
VAEKAREHGSQRRGRHAERFGRSKHGGFHGIEVELARGLNGPPTLLGLTSESFARLVRSSDAAKRHACALEGPGGTVRLDREPRTGLRDDTTPDFSRGHAAGSMSSELPLPPSGCSTRGPRGRHVHLAMTRFFQNRQTFRKTEHKP